MQPSLGRAFSPDEGVVGAPRSVIVVSHGFWRDSLGADAGVIGRNVTLNGVLCTIIGVAPRGFTGVLAGNEPSFWAPLPMMQALTRDPNYLGSRTSFWLFATGRLKDGASLEHAQAELAVLSRRIAEIAPKSHSPLEAVLFPLQLVPEPVRVYVAGFTAILMAAVGLLLLLACANVANLFLARAIAQRRELAVRAVLGASKGRLLAQMLTHSVLIALPAGGCAWFLATAGARALMRLKPANIPVELTVVFDWRVFAFSVAASLLAGLLFGIIPGMRAVDGELMPALKTEAAGAARGSRLRKVLVTVQVALCVVLLIGAALCVRSLLNARSIDPGFDTRNVLLAELDPGQLGYSANQVDQFYKRLLDRVTVLPGVASAAIASHLPLGTRSNGTSVIPRDLPADAEERPKNGAALRYPANRSRNVPWCPAAVGVHRAAGELGARGADRVHRPRKDAAPRMI